MLVGSSSAEQEASPLPPAPFADWVKPRLDARSLVVDVGCGLGHDTMALAASGMETIGFDVARTAIARAQALAATMPAPRPTFRRLDLADTRATLGQGTRLACRPVPKTVLARLTLDVLPGEAYENFWRFVRLCTAAGGMLFLESRTQPGAALPGTDPAVWRRQISLAEVDRRTSPIGGRLMARTAVSAPASGLLTDTQRIAVAFDGPTRHSFEGAPRPPQGTPPSRRP